MGRLFIIIIAVLAFISWRRWKKLNTQKARRDFIYKGMVFGLILVIIGLAAFGRIELLGAIFASLLLSIKFILAFAIRHFPIVARIYGAAGGLGVGKKPSVKTEWFELKVDFATGKIAGTIGKGQFSGAELDDLTDRELEKFVEECSQDNKSRYLLQAYLSQRFQNKGKGSGAGQNQSVSSTSMSNEEALEILGLEGNPTPDEVKIAHKRLMQKLHPDRGGNDFLASLLNRARDQLTKKVRGSNS